MNKNNQLRDEKEKVLWAVMLSQGYVRPCDMPQLDIHQNTASNWKKRHAIQARLVSDLVDVILNEEV